VRGGGGGSLTNIRLPVTRTDGNFRLAISDQKGEVEDVLDGLREGVGINHKFEKMHRCPEFVEAVGNLHDILWGLVFVLSNFCLCELFKEKNTSLKERKRKKEERKRNNANLLGGLQIMDVLLDLCDYPFLRHLMLNIERTQPINCESKIRKENKKKKKYSKSRLTKNPRWGSLMRIWKRVRPKGST